MSFKDGYFTLGTDWDGEILGADSWQGTDSQVEGVGDLYGFDGVGDDDMWEEGVSRIVLLPVGT